MHAPINSLPRSVKPGPVSPSLRQAETLPQFLDGELLSVDWSALGELLRAGKWHSDSLEPAAAYLVFRDLPLSCDIKTRGASLSPHGEGRCVMASEQNPSFDPKVFLAKVGEGRSIDKYRKDQIVFSQGDPAEAVFYIQQGKVKN